MNLEKELNNTFEFVSKYWHIEDYGDYWYITCLWWVEPTKKSDYTRKINKYILSNTNKLTKSVYVNECLLFYKK